MRKEAETASVDLLPAPQLSTWWSKMFDCQYEVATFIDDRMAKDRSAWAGLVKSENWRDFAEVQTKWLSQATLDYEAELVKLGNIYKGQFPSVPEAAKFPD